MRILIDLDGVLADFAGEADRREINYDTAELLEGFYRELPLIQDSKWAVNELKNWDMSYSSALLHLGKSRSVERKKRMG